MATYWENSCSFGLRYVSWYKYLIVSLVFSHLGFWSGNLFLIAPFPDLCLLVPFFLIKELLNKRHVKLIILPFLGTRHRFTPQEEALTKDIAKYRIHVERSTEPLNNFRILQRIVPQKLQPVFSQCVFVIACLINFQSPLVK